MIAELVKAGLGRFEEVELPDWLGEALYSDENGVLIKGAGHKYIRRVPKAGGGWRYFYTVTGGHGLGHHAEMVRGSAFKVKDAGKEGHFHVEEDHGEEVTLRHDESGKTSRVSKKALAGMLHAEHAEAVGKVRARVTANLEQAKKTGTAKQQERAAALVSKYGGVAEASPAPNVKEINAALKADPIAALKKYGQDIVGRTLNAKVTRLQPYTARQQPKITTTKKRMVVVGATEEGLQVVLVREARKNPLPYESINHYTRDTLPWARLSHSPPELSSRGPDWREAPYRINITAASIDDAPLSHKLNVEEFAEVARAAAGYRGDVAAKLWSGIANPTDAALLANSEVDVDKALGNIYRHLRDVGVNVDQRSRPGTHRLMNGVAGEQTNRDHAATVAELIRTGNPRGASVENAAQKALGEKEVARGFADFERRDADFLRRQAQDARAAEVVRRGGAT